MTIGKISCNKYKTIDKIKNEPEMASGQQLEASRQTPEINQL
ncbi:hypothetical protein BH11BAC1_BH11BAC1_26510 [soil metagenome]